MWVYFWTLYSVPLTYISGFVPIHCFDYYSFVVSSEIWEGYGSSFVLLFFWAAPCGMQDISSLTREQNPCPLHWEHSLNPWTASSLFCFVLFPRIALTILGLWWFHIHFRIIYSSSVGKCHG